jgi:hypothetical protein
MAHPGRLLLALLAALMSVAPSSRASAQSPTSVPGHDDFLRLSGRVGVQVFDYREEFGEIESEYTSVGPALGLTASLRLSERLRLNGDYLGAIVLKEEETWDNVSTGATLQENDLRVDFHVFDLDVAYAVASTHRFEWALGAGWHYYALDFTRSAFRGDSGMIQNIGPVDEEVRGQGVKVGTTLARGLTDRLTLFGGLAGYYLYRVDVDNARHGEFDSDGVAIRLGLGLEYLLTPRVTLGVGYDGHFIAVEEAKNPRGILPRNRTWAHTMSGRVGVLF